MSATVKYNGSTIASVEDGASVELDTQGKYMSGNVTVEAEIVPEPSYQSKTVTPTTSQQTIAPDNGYDGLSQVIINAIPEKFGDTTGDTGTAANVLAGIKVHTIVNGTATQITGSMTNNGAISGSINGLTTMIYSVPAGYTTGGTVSLTSDIEDALAAI